MLHHYKQPTEYISRRASHQAGGDFMIHACPSINKPTEQHPRLQLSPEPGKKRLSALNTPAQLLISFPGFLRT